MGPNELFEGTFEANGVTTYFLRDGRVIVDGDKVIPYLSEQGDREYAWELVVDETRPGMVLQGIMIALGTFVVPFVILWALGRIPVVLVQYVILGLAVVACVTTVVMVLTARTRDLRHAGPSWRQGPSADRYKRFTHALELIFASACLAAAIFNGSSPVADEFGEQDVSGINEIGFVTYQIMRVVTLDSIEIADVSWTDLTPRSAGATTISILLNILLSSGIVAFIVHSWNDMKRRAEPFTGDTFDVLWNLKHEPTPGNKWIDLVGASEGVPHRTLSLREFIAAYEADLIPASRPVSLAGPFN